MTKSAAAKLDTLTAGTTIAVRCSADCGGDTIVGTFVGATSYAVRVRRPEGNTVGISRDGILTIRTI